MKLQEELEIETIDFDNVLEDGIEIIINESLFQEFEKEAKKLKLKSKELNENENKNELTKGKVSIK